MWPWGLRVQVPSLTRFFHCIHGAASSYYMKKLLLMPVLLVLGCFCAGLYGVLHDQLSYAVSHEYFTRFKFFQFNIPPHLRGHVGAAIVGWSATWWMGIVIGVFIIPTGLIIRGTRAFFITTLKSFVVVTLTAAVIGLGALLVSFFTIRESARPPFWYPDGIIDKVSFARVGTMHNFSYLGGMIGIITGVIYLIRARSKTK